MEKEITIELVQEYLRNTEFGLHSTHSRLSFPILKRICEKLQNGERFDPIRVADGMIINGHHRYISYHILNIQIQHVEWEKNHSSVPMFWNQVIIDFQDWDNPEP